MTFYDESNTTFHDESNMAFYDESNMTFYDESNMTFYDESNMTFYDESFMTSHGQNLGVQGKEIFDFYDRNTTVSDFNSTLSKVNKYAEQQPTVTMGNCAISKMVKVVVSVNHAQGKLINIASLQDTSPILEPLNAKVFVSSNKVSFSILFFI